MPREEEKVKKDKKDKKEKEKEKDSALEKKDRKEKDPEKKDKKDKSSAPLAADRPSSSRAAPSKPAGKPASKVQNDYLAGMELPSSDDEEEYEKEEVQEEKKALTVQVSARETKKLVDKERKAAEKAYVAKLEALKDDDNVFDVAFEGMGEEATASATDVKVHNLTVRAKGKILLENTSLTIAEKRRYGLVGPNGMGKSTLLRLMARRQIPVPEGIDVLLVEQEVVGDDRSALQAVVAADVELMSLREEEQTLNAKLNDESLRDSTFDADEASARLTEVYERMTEIGASTAESRASRILHGLGFCEAWQKRPTQSFSGGWRMRISLARALYIQPTLLLLDEPTNHLDLRAVLWLEEYLTRWKKTLIVVSHDRDFLNTITTDIIHLHDRALHFYRGNFAQFEEMYEQRRRETNKAAEKFEKQLKAAKASKNARVNAEKVKAGAKMDAAKRAKGKGKENAEDNGPTDNVPRKWSDYTVEFHFPEPTELNPPMLQLNDACFKYPGRDDFGMKNLNFGIDMGSRVAIVGPNGAGKSTLMALIAGDLTPTSGEQRRNRAVKVGKYSQHFVDALSFDENPVEYLLNRFPELNLKPEDFRAKLGKFGLSGAHHLTPICKLSGGQKARVVFTRIYYENPHILLMDEPTNHLDMQSIDALGEALEEFEGGVVVISHDAQLLSRICSDEEKAEVWVVEDGTVRTYPGDFEDYRNELIKEITKELDEE